MFQQHDISGHHTMTQTTRTSTILKPPELPQAAPRKKPCWILGSNPRTTRSSCRRRKKLSTATQRHYEILNCQLPPWGLYRPPKQSKPKTTSRRQAIKIPEHPTHQDLPTQAHSEQRLTPHGTTATTRLASAPARLCIRFTQARARGCTARSES